MHVSHGTRLHCNGLHLLHAWRSFSSAKIFPHPLHSVRLSLSFSLISRRILSWSVLEASSPLTSDRKVLKSSSVRRSSSLRSLSSCFSYPLIVDRTTSRKDASFTWTLEAPSSVSRCTSFHAAWSGPTSNVASRRSSPMIDRACGSHTFGSLEVEGICS